MSRDGLAPTSVSRAVSAARGFFRFLMLDGHIKRHPAEDIHTPQQNARLPQFLSEEDMERLLLAPDVKTDTGVRDRAMLEILYAAGLRVSEMCGLRTSDIDLNAALLTCYGKGSKQRRIPIGKSAVHWLQRYLTVRRQLGNEAKPELFCTSWPADDAANRLGDHQDTCRPGGRARHLAAYFASQLWDPSHAARCRLAFSTGVAGSLRHLDDRDLYAHH